MASSTESSTERPWSRSVDGREHALDEETALPGVWPEGAFPPEHGRAQHSPGAGSPAADVRLVAEGLHAERHETTSLSAAAQEGVNGQPAGTEDGHGTICTAFHSPSSGTNSTPKLSCSSELSRTRMVRNFLRTSALT